MKAKKEQNTKRIVDQSRNGPGTASGKEMALTPVQEDYLKIILVISKAEGCAGVTDIANRLHVSKPTVSKTIGRLATMGLVEREKYGKIRLTDSGHTQATIILKKNDIINRFLGSVLTVDKITSKNDACRLEHIISFQTIDRMEALIQEG